MASWEEGVPESRGAGSDGGGETGSCARIAGGEEIGTPCGEQVKTGPQRSKFARDAAACGQVIYWYEAERPNTIISCYLQPEIGAPIIFSGTHGVASFLNLSENRDLSVDAELMSRLALCICPFKADP